MVVLARIGSLKKLLQLIELFLSLTFFWQNLSLLTPRGKSLVTSAGNLQLIGSKYIIVLLIGQLEPDAPPKTLKDLEKQISLLC